MLERRAGTKMGMVIQRSEASVFDDRLRTVKEMTYGLLAEARGQASQTITIDPKDGVDFFDAVARFESLLIETALEMTGGHQRDAAKLLNLGTSTLCTKIKRLGIPINGRSSEGPSSPDE